MEKFVRAITTPVAAAPLATRTERDVDYELFTQPLVPDGGKAVVTGFVVPPVSDPYRIGLRTIFGSSADKPEVAIKNGFNPAVLPNLQTVELAAGKHHPFTANIQIPVLQFGELEWQRVSHVPRRTSPPPHAVPT